MALPKFTTTPTPLYQQQPIIRTQNYGDLYMRNFAAAEASTYKTFAGIGVALEKKREKREKELELELERDSIKWKAKSQGRKDRDYAEVIDRLKTLNAQTEGSEGGDVTSKVYSELQRMRDGVSALPQQIRDGLITRDDAQVIEDSYNVAIGTYKPALQVLDTFKTRLRDKSRGHLLDNYTKGLKDGNFKAASLAHELEDKDGYDLKFSLGGSNGLQPIVSWTDDTKKDDDGKFLEYEYTLTELKDIDFFNDWDEEFNYENEDYKKTQTVINEELQKNPDFIEASKPPPYFTSTVKDDYSTGVKRTGKETRQERSMGNYNRMRKEYAKEWLKLNPGNSYEKWKQFQDIIVIGAPEDEYYDIAMEIVSQNPDQYKSTADGDEDGIPDNVEELIRVIGSFNTWEDGWEQEKDNINVMREFDRILSKDSFKNFYANQTYGRTNKAYNSWDKAPTFQEGLTTNLTDIQENKKRNLETINYLPTIIKMIDNTLNRDPALANMASYNEMKTTIINNFPHMKDVLKTKDAVWGTLGDADVSTATDISMGEVNIPVNAPPGIINDKKRDILTRIIENDPAFAGMEFDNVKFWKGYKFSEMDFLSEESEKAVQYYTNWLKKAALPWEEAKLP
ncbi:MAG: hypothetical protein HN905_03195 [Candidatus Marinimicrobia bacterium]|jgi:hypothetical protein|nr:hypothetical protein [Candidatus Neomarinimicrobiota bacterium]